MHRNASLEELLAHATWPFIARRRIQSSPGVISVQRGGGILRGMHYHYFTLEQRESLASLMRQRFEGESLRMALEQLRDPGYGICASCGADIPFVKLEENPAARTCRRCA